MRVVTMDEMMKEINNIEKGKKKSQSDACSSTKKSTNRMDDLLREIKRLSTQVKDVDTDSEAVVSQPTDKLRDFRQRISIGAKKMAKRRQKRRNKKNRGRKRRLKYQADQEVESSSFTDCTDEEVIRDYIDNITKNLSDTDVGISLRKGMFLVQQDLGSPHHDFHDEVRISPEVDETDSLSESFRLTQSRKKRRKYKRHSIEGLDLELSTGVSSHQKSLIKSCIERQYNKSNSKKIKFENGMSVEDGGEGVPDKKPNKILTGSIEDYQPSDNSDSSSNSHLGSEADDEGEETSWESGPVKKVIPWWENKDDADMDDDTSEELSLSLQPATSTSNFHARLHQNSTPMDILCESGGYAAFANHRIRKFVQHRDSTELSLYTKNKKEQDQVSQLAVLYNLLYSVEEASRSSKVVLTKTRHTKEADQDALKLFLSRVVKLKCRKVRAGSQWNYKRRKILTPQVLQEGSSYNCEMLDVPIPETNVGNQMLRGMGWKPGQGLGKDNGGPMFPVKPVKRPRNLGLGHPGGS